MGIILAIDPGDVRIGLAISDPTGLIARPLIILRHHSRQRDVERILQIAQDHGAEKILVGVALDTEGEAGPQARKALRLVKALREATNLEVVTWDESGSSQRARSIGKKGDRIDARAAAFILQEFLNETQT